MFNIQNQSTSQVGRKFAGQIINILKLILTASKDNEKCVKIYHDFLPTPRMGSHVKSGKTHTQSSRYTP